MPLILLIGRKMARNSPSAYLRMHSTQSDSYEFERNILKIQPNRNIIKSNQRKSKTFYEFTKIFYNDSTNFDIYQNCVHKSIEYGENLTVLTYGSTPSDKNTTMFGSECDAGVMQRAIVHIFTKYGDVIHDDPVLKLDKGKITWLTNEMIKAENELRDRFVKPTGTGYLHHSFDFERIFQGFVRDVHKFKPMNGRDVPNVFIWVSFVQFQNDTIYDKLALHEKQQTKCKNLNIFSNDGNPFIEDLTTVHVRSAYEAMAVINWALKQSKIDNSFKRADQDHLVGMIHIIEYSTPNQQTTITYTFCDSVSTKGSKLPITAHQRPLIVLGDCLKLMHQNNKFGTDDVIPFKDSKLTTLLQKSLIGLDKMATIVDLLPNLNRMNRNMQLLQFVAINCRIVRNIPIMPRREVDVLKRKLYHLLNEKRRLTREKDERLKLLQALRAVLHGEYEYIRIGPTVTAA